MKRPFFSTYNGVFIEYLKNYDIYNVPVQQYHDGYEIYILLSGERLLFYNDTCWHLKAGDAAIVKPYELHCGESCDVEFYERYVVNFRSEDMSCILTENERTRLFDRFDSRLIHLDKDKFDDVHNCLKTMEKISVIHDRLSSKAMYSAVLQLVLLLKNTPQTYVETVPSGIPHEIVESLNYINNHYMENITLDMLAETVHISKYHFCRLFKESTNTTFLEYLRNVRLSHAHRLLAENIPIKDIAVQTGFGASAYLSRVFKKVHGISPQEFRGQMNKSY